MRTLGWLGALLVAMNLVGCGPANSLEDGSGEEGPYTPAPKIEYPKPKSGSRSPAKSTAPAKPEAKK